MLYGKSQLDMLLADLKQKGSGHYGKEIGSQETLTQIFTKTTQADGHGPYQSKGHCTGNGQDR